MSIKRMNNLKTLQTRRDEARPHSRAEMATKLARLEHEMTRLERESEILAEKSRKTSQKMAQVTQQIDELRTLLYNDRPKGDHSRRHDMDSDRDEGGSSSVPPPDNDRSERKLHVVTLDY